MVPVVAIVGRPNVGKSSLLNALARRRISIVDSTPGTTRDRVSTEVEIEDFIVDLVDTGGIGIVDSQRLESDVEAQINVAIAAANIILFVVDVRDGLLPLDKVVAERLRKQSGTPVILVVNKCDVPKFELQTGEFHALGVKDIIAVSAIERRGLDDLREKLHALLKTLPVEKRTDPTLKLAIVGKRNSGKSTLVNALANADRVIVNELPGTTRDSIDVRFRYQNHEILAIDTAGVQRQRSVENSLEFYSQHRSLRSIRRADVVILLHDCLEPLTEVDKRLAEAILRAGKPMVIGVNKWDLADNARTGDYEKYVRDRLPRFDFAPVAFLSAKQGNNMWQTIKLVEELHRQATTRVGTGVLNRFFEEVLEKRPAQVGLRRAKFYFATQVDVLPPTIVMFVNDPELVPSEYFRYLMNQMHANLPFSEVPIRLILREKIRKTDAPSGKDEEQAAYAGADAEPVIEPVQPLPGPDDEAGADELLVDDDREISGEAPRPKIRKS